MKVVIFASGLGTRLPEETVTISKPMVQNRAASYGCEEFVVELSCRAEMVTSLFLQFADLASEHHRRSRYRKWSGADATGRAARSISLSPSLRRSPAGACIA
jgi:hypothetical protein